MKQNPATITATLAAGSAASPYFVQANISQKLCSPSCVDETPVFNPAYTFKSIAEVGTGQYVVTVHVEGIIAYVPCGRNTCCTRSQLISQDFTIPLASATAPTSVTITQGATVNAIAQVGCQNCSRDFVSETPLTITVA
jgi:hypothetical protein